MEQKFIFEDKSKTPSRLDSTQNPPVDALSKELRRELISVVCPNCGTSMQKMGSWLISVPAFQCPACARRTAMSYGQKVKIFERHLKLKALAASA